MNPAVHSPGQISVLMPVYNHAPYVDEALSSVVGEPGVEVIAINDGSTDLSGAALEKWRQAGSPGLRVEHQTNAGVTKTLNRALALARGEFVCVLASDDARVPGSLRQQARFLERDASADGVFGDLEVMGTRERLIAAPREGQVMRHEEVLRWTNRAYLQGMLLRTEFVRRLGGFDERLTFEDLDFLLRASRSGVLRYHPELTVRYRVNEAGLSTAYLRHEASLLAVIAREAIPYPPQVRATAEGAAWAHLASRAYAARDFVNLRRFALRGIATGDGSVRAHVLKLAARSLLGSTVLDRVRELMK